MPSLKPTTTSLFKPGMLSHHSPITTIPSSNESAACISLQSVTSIFSSNPVMGGNFVIFRRKTQHSSPAPSPTRQSWDVISGWGFRVTARGTLVYTGRERALESGFVQFWGTGGGELQKLVDSSERAERRRFALMGPGNHTSYLKCPYGTGTWRRVLGGSDPGKSEKSTHCVFIELPEVVGMLIARGVRADEVVGCLVPGKWGTMRIEGEVGEWSEPEMVDEEKVEDGKEWKKGWWMTRRKGMGVWVS